MAATRLSTEKLLAREATAAALAGPPWVHAIRAHAVEVFRQEGLPSIKHEEWRFTSVAQIAKTAWQVAPPEAGSRLRPIDIAPHLPAGMDGPRLVFINGRFAQRLSSRGHNGIHLQSLAEAINGKNRSRVVQAHLSQHAEIDGEAFTALNTAFFEDGAFVHLERGQVFEQPVQLLYLTLSGDEPALSEPRSLVVLDSGSSATLIEIHAGLGEKPHFANSVCETVVCENASLAHVLVQFEDNAGSAIGLHRARVDRGGHFSSRAFSFGKALCRNSVHCVLNGEGAEAHLGGLYLGRGHHHIDFHVYVEHARAQGTSRQLYRGVLDEKAHGVFSGKVVVRPGAQKTDAQQTNNNILLSDDAQIDTKPQLEIYADDVKCSHGATSGRLDEDALFFLRSRGLAEREARSLLTYAFCAELIEAVKVEPVKEALTKMVQARFQ